MAVFYDLGVLLKKQKEQPELIDAILNKFVLKANKRIKKIKESIDLKDYTKVGKQVSKLLPPLELLAMEESIDEANLILDWTKTEGKTKVVKEVVKSFSLKVLGAAKEVRKDFNINDKV